MVVWFEKGSVLVGWCFFSVFWGDLRGLVVILEGALDGFVGDLRVGLAV